MNDDPVPHEVAVMAAQCTGRGANGVVAAAAPLAAGIGASILAEGGNAFDAAVAMGLAEAVLLPPKCGLGGDLVAIVLAAGSDEPEALVAIGGAPTGLAAVVTAGNWSDVGPTSVGPPAAPAGYQALARRGRLPLPHLAAPAIALAEGGFPWAEVCTRLSEQAAELVHRMNPAGTAYYPDGRPITPGAIVRLPRLAAALASFAELGEGFLDGPVGRAIVDTVRAAGGVLSPDDLRFASAQWAPCAVGQAGPLTAWATPAPTYGPTLLDAVSGATADDDAGAHYRRFLAATSRRQATLGDPSGTSMVSAADRHGNVVVLIHSNSYPRFGSGLVVEDFQLVLANRAGRGFTPQPGHPNFPTPGRRPATTLHAWAVADATGAPRLMGGTPGGANQVPWNVQTLGRVVAGQWSPGRLVTAPLWEWLPDDDGVRLEGGLSPRDTEALEATAPRVTRVARWGCKSAQQVVQVRRDGEAFEAAADPRTVGAAHGI